MRFLLFTSLLLCVLAAQADTLRVAVAANFAAAARSLAADFQNSTGHDVKLAFGSTGKHYAQIRNGAPFDAFLAADVERPKRLEAEGLAIAGTRFTYATGSVVLWSPSPRLVDDDGRVLAQDEFRHLAIANPRVAPYGRAARQVLERLGLWESLQDRLVRGENIGQAFHMVRGGGADLGFVAFSQLHQPATPHGGSFWLPPAEWYDPIEQQAVLLRDGPGPRAWSDYLRSEPARIIIRRHGYKAP